MIPGDAEDLNNYIELVLWIPSIVGLLLMKKWGIALTTAVMCITLGTSRGNLLLAYYTNLMTAPFAYVNALRIIVNAAIAVFLFRSIFQIRFK